MRPRPLKFSQTQQALTGIFDNPLAIKDIIQNLILVALSKPRIFSNFGGWRSYSIEGGSEPGKARSSAETPVATGVLDTLRERI